SSAAASPARPSTYLALGDSVAAGVGADAPATGGYVPLLADLLRARLGCDDAGAAGCPLTLRPLAVSGATTATVLRDQLPAATGLLRGGTDVALVTLTVGGNDVFGPVLLACFPDPAVAACRTAVTGALTEADTGIDRVLDGLDAAAPDGTPLAVMTYYDPLPTCRLAALAPLAEQVLEGSGTQRGLNDLLRARAREHGAVVVETAGRVRDRADLVGGGDCLHPSARGHARLAEAFDDAVGARVVAGRQESAR
ncbi:MAG: hypothetical protein JWO60_1114, partial [Frankiales bacterium]|nr:hypothetical protein [Frankiales bacterium]